MGSRPSPHLGKGQGPHSGEVALRKAMSDTARDGVGQGLSLMKPPSNLTVR